MQNIRILIVEDETNIAKTIEATFSGQDWQTAVCPDGITAWKMLSEESWDVVFLDIRLPGIDGMEIIRRIHEHEIKTDVIMITAFGSVEFAVQAMKYGAVDFIQKPFEPQLLRSIVSGIEARKKLVEHQINEYSEFVELSKQQIKDRDYHRAQISLRNALKIKPESAEAHNLLGAVYEILGDKSYAAQAYQMALSFDKDYKPAKENIRRITSLEENSTDLANLMAALKSDK
jgi:DNA-binding NtrC family response regulator